jgi:hypothetical protein
MNANKEVNGKGFELEVLTDEKGPAHCIKCSGSKSFEEVAEIICAWGFVNEPGTFFYPPSRVVGVRLLRRQEN